MTKAELQKSIRRAVRAYVNPRKVCLEVQDQCHGPKRTASGLRHLDFDDWDGSMVSYTWAVKNAVVGDHFCVCVYEKSKDYWLIGHIDVKVTEEGAKVTQVLLD